MIILIIQIVIWVYNMLIDQAIHADGNIREDVVDRLNKIYSEVKESGDKYKYRAAAEVMKSAVTKAKHLDTDARMKVNRIAQQSKRDMQEIRSTPGMAKAYEHAEEAWTEYRAAR